VGKIVKTTMVEPRQLEFWGFNKNKIREIRRWIPIVLKDAQRRTKSKRKFPSPIVAMSKEEIGEGQSVVDKAHPKGAGHGLYYIDYQLVKVNPHMEPLNILANVLHENIHHLRPDWGEIKTKRLTGEIMHDHFGEEMFGQPVMERRRNASPRRSKKKLVIVSLFDRSGRMIEPWIGQGHTIYTIDMGPKTYPNWKGVKHIQGDVRDIEPLDSDILFSFPPCTDFSIAGNRWVPRKLAKDPHYMEKALELVDVARNWAALSHYWMIENPAGKLGKLWRDPNWYFQPYQYAGYARGAEQLFNYYTKKTAIWSNFAKPDPRYIEPQYKVTSKPVNIEGKEVPCEIRPRSFGEQEKFARKILSKGVAHLKGAEKKKYLRSLTPSGFAQAIYAYLMSNPVAQQVLFYPRSPYEGRAVVPNPSRR
jgi:hypothetical protein